MISDQGFDGLAGFDALVRRRRTSLVLDPQRPVPDELVGRLAELVTWAPNHKRTWPWQVAWVTGDGRSRLGEVAAEAMAARGDEPAKVDKTRRKYLRAPGMLVIGSAPGDTPLRTVENRDAVAAGVQNVLLGATAVGLASFWSSCPKGADEAVRDLCGFPPGTAVVAMIYLGWPTGTVETPVRPPLVLRRIDRR
jgi:nitroreductase